MRKMSLMPASPRRSASSRPAGTLVTGSGTSSPSLPVWGNHVPGRLHGGDVRKGTTIPYVSHVLGVASLALEHGANEDEAIGALLHDTVEDATGDSESVRTEIRRRFGPAVLDIVDGCTDARTKPKPPFRERKERYIAHLPEASPSVRLVSAADKLYNARAILSDYRAIGEALWARFNGGRSGTLWYYRALADAFRTLGPGRLAEELDRVVSELEQLAGPLPPRLPN
jgi:5'-deoxynucleotidase YfbR-like HD superfamily hydrolase